MANITPWTGLAIATGIILVLCGAMTLHQRKSTTKADDKGDACPATWYTWVPVIVGGLILAIALGTAFVKVRGPAGGNKGPSDPSLLGDSKNAPPPGQY
jgi:hypothetical protein